MDDFGCSVVHNLNANRTLYRLNNLSPFPPWIELPLQLELKAIQDHQLHMYVGICVLDHTNASGYVQLLPFCF